MFYLNEILLIVMNVKQKFVCVHDDMHPLASSKVQKKVDSKTVENYVLNETVSVSCARMQVRPVGCGSKEIVPSKCAIRWKPPKCGTREGSLSSMDCVDFEKRIKGVNIVGLENKVLLVKVMKDGTESETMEGKPLPKFHRKQSSFARCRHSLGKLPTSSIKREDRHTDDCKLGKRESDFASETIHSSVCRVSLALEKKPVQLEGHERSGHGPDSVQKKVAEVSNISKDLPLNIYKCSSEDASLYVTSLRNSITEIHEDASKSFRNSGTSENSSKAKHALVIPVSKRNVISGNVCRVDIGKAVPLPSQKVFNLSQYLSEKANIHVECVEKAVNETYKVKCLEDGRCSIKKIGEQPKLPKSFGKEIVLEGRKIDSSTHETLPMLSVSGSEPFKDLCLYTSDINSVLVDDLLTYEYCMSEKGSDLFKDCSVPVSDMNDVHVDSLSGGIYHHKHRDNPLPKVFDAECCTDQQGTEKSVFSASNATNRGVQQNLFRPIIDSANHLSFRSPPSSMPDMKDSNWKDTEKSSVFPELFSKLYDQFEPAKHKTTEFMPEGFSPQTGPNNIKAVYLNQCSSVDVSSFQSTDDLVLKRLIKPIEDNIDGMVTHNELSQVVGTTEGLSVSCNSMTGSKEDNVLSNVIPDNPHFEPFNLKVAVTVQGQENEKPVLRNCEALSPRDPFDEIGPSHIPVSDVVWTLQTPKPSVAPLITSVSDNWESFINKLPATGKEKGKYCNSSYVLSSESNPSVYNEITKNCENGVRNSDILETINEKVDADYSNQSNFSARRCKVDDSGLPASILELNEEVRTAKEFTKSSCQENPFGLEKNEMNRCLYSELPSNLNNPNISEMLVVTGPLSGSYSSGNFGQTNVSPVNDFNEIDSVFDDIPCLPDISTTLTCGFSHEVADDAHSHQSAHVNLQSFNSGVNTNETWSSLGIAPLSFNQSVTEQPFGSDMSNANDFDNLLDSFLQEVDQGCIDSDPSKQVCFYSKNEENQNSSKNVLHNSLLTSMKIGSKFEELIDDIFKDLGDKSPPQILNSDSVEFPQEHSVRHQKEKDVSLEVVQSLPLPAPGNVKKDFSDDQIKNDACRRVARTVSFKMRPATRPVKCVVRGQVVEHELQKQPRPLRFILGKDRRLQNQDGSTSWPQREEFNPNQFSIPRERNAIGLKDKKQIENGISKNSTTNSNPNVIPATSVGMGNVATTVTHFNVPGGVYEDTRFVLPVGKTGVSISIPASAPTNITSFFPPPDPVSSESSATNTIPNHPCVKPSYNENQVINVTSSVKSHTPVLSNPPQQGKSVLQSEDASQIIIPNTVITVGGTGQEMYQVSLPQTTPLESLYMMVPSSSSVQSDSGASTPSLLSNILPQHTSEQVYNSNAVMSNLVSRCAKPQVPTKHCPKSYVHPIAPKGSQQNPKTYIPAKIPLLFNAKTSEPIKILINTKSNNVNTISSAYSQEKVITEGVTSSETGIKSEFDQSLRQKILKRKPYPNFIQKKFNRLLREELRVHFPDIPDSILKVLSLPSQAVRRGYFSVRDLKSLRTQALALRLGIIFREHVCVCTAHSCPTCFEFLQQRDALSLAERKRRINSKSHVKSGISGGRGRSKGRGHRRKSVRADYEENMSNTVSSPHLSFIASSKRKVDDVSQAIYHNKTLKIARADNLAKNTVKVSVISEEADENYVTNKAFIGKLKVKRSNSDLDIHTHAEVPPLKDDGPQSCDDSYLMIYHSIKDSRHFQNMKWPVTSKENKGFENKGILINDHMGNKSEKRWESRQNTNMMKAAFDDLHLKKQLEKDFVPFTEEETEQSKNQSTGFFQKPLYFDLHSLEIGPLNLVAKFEQPKLHVLYTARKFVYEFEIKQTGEKGNHQKPAVVESQNDSPLQLYLAVDIPFSTLQAINIAYNTVLLVLNTIPVVQVMGMRGTSHIAVTEKDVLSKAQLTYLSHVKAALTIYPLHKVLIPNRARALSLHDGLCEFSDWFSRMLCKHIPVQDDQIPSWSLASYVDASFMVSKQRTAVPGGVDHVLSTQNHSLPHESFHQKTWQEQVRNTPVTQGSDIIMNTATSPSSAAMYLISAVKAALGSQGVLHPVPFSPALQFPLAPYLKKGCTCEGTCHIMECPCARAGALCCTKQTCQCKECDNPLNILHVLGLDVHTARVDECLMQNLYSYDMAGLCSLLVSQVILPCCGAAPELLHIIPGTVVCNCCGMAVCYSWCSHHIHLQNLCPRNHCLVCCCCKPALHTHCQAGSTSNVYPWSASAYETDRTGAEACSKKLRWMKTVPNKPRIDSYLICLTT
ncbi:uncharacterized protein [Panulirus ornatus]|uniref:uncharacterized protein isoform X2 n=1 Tax=Panulirus ornatus TaxID=150431 RepID=UPI003A835B34